LAFADQIVLNKTELGVGAGIARCRYALRKINPWRRFIGAALQRCAGQGAGARGFDIERIVSLEPDFLHPEDMTMVMGEEGPRA